MTTIDPAIARRVITLKDAGHTVQSIGDQTGLLDREIKAVLDAELLRRRSLHSVPAPAESPQSELDSLLERAAASSLRRVQQAGERTKAAIDRLRQLLADTEQEAREQAERAARIKAAEEALAAAKRELAELRPKGKKTGRTNNISPEGREKLRRNAAIARDAAAARRAERAG